MALPCSFRMKMALERFDESDRIRIRKGTKKIEKKWKNGCFSFSSWNRLEWKPDEEKPSDD